MFGKTGLQAILVVWVLWHLAFGVLATFAPDLGARLTGWSPSGGWTTDMLALSTQYGMAMLLLAGVYTVMASDPVRYLALLWVAIAEQVLGIAYAVYIYIGIGGVALAPIAIQSAINLGIIAVFLGFRANLRPRSAAAAA